MTLGTDNSLQSLLRTLLKKFRRLAASSPLDTPLSRRLLQVKRKHFNSHGGPALKAVDQLDALTFADALSDMLSSISFPLALLFFVGAISFFLRKWPLRCDLHFVVSTDISLTDASCSQHWSVCLLQEFPGVPAE